MIEADRPLAAPAFTVFGALVILFASILAYSPTTLLSSPPEPSSVWWEYFILAGPGTGLILAVLGMLVYWRPLYRTLLGPVIVTFAILGFFAGLLGFIIGPILGIVGGVLSVTFESRSQEDVEAERVGIPGFFRTHYWVLPVGFIACGIVMASVAPLFPGLYCSQLPSGYCPPGQTCPAIAVGCGGFSLWVVFLAVGVITAPLAFRVRFLDTTTPIPF